MQEIVRRLLEEHGRLHSPVAGLSSDADLYDAGLTPFAAIRVMLALEEQFEIEFPVRMLCRQSFASIDAIAACLVELVGHVGQDRQQPRRLTAAAMLALRSPPRYIAGRRAFG